MACPRGREGGSKRKEGVLVRMLKLVIVEALLLLSEYDGARIDDDAWNPIS